MRILVLGGGNSVERDVSIRSAKAVSDALKMAGYAVDQADPKDGLGFLDSIATDNIIFPILHGAEGEDGVIQKAMEDRNIPFLGSSSEVSAVCFDKGTARSKLQAAGIAVAQGASVTAETYQAHPLASRPHVLKVQRGGSSIGTYLVHDPADIDQSKVAEVFSLDHNAIIEELIVGLEITVPILDGVALPVIEIRPPKNGEFDYENKYNGKSQETCPAVSLNEAAQKHAQAIAEQVHKMSGCRHLSRVDIMVRQNGEMVVLEINTMPGLTNQSLYPLSAKVSGLDMQELMKNFVGLVKRDYKF